MANKVLEKTLNNVDAEDMKPGYAAPGQVASDAFGNITVPPGALSGTSETMSVTGSARAALLLFALVVASGTWAWITIPSSSAGLVLLVSLLVAFGFGLLTTFRPKNAIITAPLYALAEGVVMGVFSRLFENQYSGIVVQAVLATGAIVFVMYTLYSTRILKVTPRFQKIVFASMMAALVFLMVNMLISIFGGTNLMAQGGILGIVIPGVLIVIGAGMLALDFDFIEKGSQSGLPKYMDWAAGYGLVVTIVWIYINVLRMLANSRN